MRQWDQISWALGLQSSSNHDLKIALDNPKAVGAVHAIACSGAKLKARSFTDVLKYQASLPNCFQLSTVYSNLCHTLQQLGQASSYDYRAGFDYSMA